MVRDVGKNARLLLQHFLFVERKVTWQQRFRFDGDN
jgi:hypothetical protein